LARPLRVDIVDGVYHVMSRGIDRSCIFKDDRKREGSEHQAQCK
jgi:hypothetical protein